MNKEDFIEKLSANGRLVNKRCTESYIANNNLSDILDNLVDKSFGSVSDRIKYLKYGGGYCEVCGIRTNLENNGQGFAKYCKAHFHEPKKNKPAHNRKTFDIDAAIKLYHDEKKSLLEISTLFNVSNVTLANRFKEANVTLRSHSENQKLYCKRNYTKPNIIIDRKELVYAYTIDKIPTKILATQYNCHEETIRRFLIQEGVARNNNRSYIEQHIINILDDLNIKYEINNRKLLNGKEIDFFLYEYNIGIEVNGLATHSVIRGSKDSSYHYNKYKSALDNNIKLIQFWETDIVKKPAIIKNIIANICKLTINKLDARKCTVDDVELTAAKEFCINNHIQGIPGNNVHSKGLTYNNELVALMCYSIKDDTTIINRYCTLLNYNIRGGFSKLLKYIPGNRIKTYSANDLSNGLLYEKNGFNMIHQKNHNMFYTDYNILYNREKFMKKYLPDLLDIYDETKTEIENMIINGYDVIYKSGTKTWILEK